MTDVQAPSQTQLPDPPAAPKDFTDRTHTNYRSFKIDDDLFYCARVVPAGVGRELMSLVHAPDEQQFDGIGRILDMVILPDSAELFAKRMTDPLNPISIDQIRDIINWLMEEYAERPTVPSDSSTLPAAPTVRTGISSTDGQHPEVSIP